MQQNDYVLTPGRYVGGAARKEEPEPFEEKMGRLTATLREPFAEGARLEGEIRRNFARLVSTIERTPTAHAGRAVSMSLTLRSWMIGFYIREYGQARRPRGVRLLESLATGLRGAGLQRVAVRELWRSRHFYTEYPQIRVTVSPESSGALRLDRVAAGVESSGAGGNIEPSASAACVLDPTCQV